MKKTSTKKTKKNNLYCIPGNDDCQHNPFFEQKKNKQKETNQNNIDKNILVYKN